MILRCLAGALALALFMAPAAAKHRHVHHVDRPSSFREGAPVHCDDRYPTTCDTRGWRENSTHRIEIHAGGVGPRPRAWCGWYARQLVGQDPDPSYNLARNWAHWGHAAAPGPGVMVVWPHHVGMITGLAPNGQWVVKSGNDGPRVRERPLSVSRAIAFRAS